MSEHFPWRSVAALAALSALGAAAQPAAPGPAAAPAAVDSKTRPMPAPYRSVFENYQPFADEQPVPWKEANDTVRAIGGWRAYAREASAQPAKPASAPATPAAPHHGHGTP